MTDLERQFETTPRDKKFEWINTLSNEQLKDLELYLRSFPSPGLFGSNDKWGLVIYVRALSLKRSKEHKLQ